MSLRSSPIVCAISVVALALVAAFVFTAGSPAARADEPEITSQFPEDGQVIAEPPIVLQMCFKDPVDVRDLPPLDEGDFAFTITRPDDINLGMRIVFQPDGYGVSIYPGTAGEEPPEGAWTWDYRVVDAASLDVLEGTVTFTTNAAEGDEILQPTPRACLAEGATDQPTLIPVPSGGSGTPTPDTAGDNDDDPGILTLALITIGIAAAAAVAGVIAYFVRKRVGYEPHAPSGGSGESGDSGEPGDGQH